MTGSKVEGLRRGVIGWNLCSRTVFLEAVQALRRTSHICQCRSHTVGGGGSSSMPIKQQAAIPVAG